MSTHTTDRTQTDLAVVQDIYAAFGRGDVPAILDQIAEGCRWEDWTDHSAQQAGVAYLQPRTGPAGVAEFFAALADLQIHDFQVLGYLTGECEVLAKIIMEASTTNRGRFRDEELHLWTLDEHGRVVRFRHYVATAKHIAAAGGVDTTRAATA